MTEAQEIWRGDFREHRPRTEEVTFRVLAEEQTPTGSEEGKERQTPMGSEEGGESTRMINAVIYWYQLVLPR